MSRKAKPKKLRNGQWGAVVDGVVSSGDTITITTAAGKSWTATVSRVIWVGGGVSIVATRSRSSEMCADCGERTGTVDAPDSSGIIASVCRQCARLPSAERSYS